MINLAADKAAGNLENEFCGLDAETKLIKKVVDKRNGLM